MHAAGATTCMPQPLPRLLACRPAARAGHSRIPVHRPGDRSAVLGIMLVKELLMVRGAAADGSAVELLGARGRRLSWLEGHGGPAPAARFSPRQPQHRRQVPAPAPARPSPPCRQVDKDAGVPVGRQKVRSLPAVRAETPLYDMLKVSGWAGGGRMRGGWGG